MKTSAKTWKTDWMLVAASWIYTLSLEIMFSVDKLSEHVRNNTENLKLLTTVVSRLPLTDTIDQASKARSIPPSTAAS